MPNWILTNYVFWGNKDDLMKLDEAIRECEKSEESEGHSQEVSLCEIIDYFGGDYNKIPCNGHIAECLPYDGGSYFEVQTMTANGLQHEPWDFIVSKLPSLSYQFTTDHGDD